MSHKLAPARGIMIGLAVVVLFWVGVGYAFSDNAALADCVANTDLSRDTCLHMLRP